MTFDAIADWLNRKGHLTVRGEKFRGARSFHLEKEIGKAIVAEPRVSASVVRVQYRGGR